MLVHLNPNKKSSLIQEISYIHYFKQVNYQMRMKKSNRKENCNISKHTQSGKDLLKLEMRKNCNKVNTIFNSKLLKTRPGDLVMPDPFERFFG